MPGYNNNEDDDDEYFEPEDDYMEPEDYYIEDDDDDIITGLYRIIVRGMIIFDRA